MIPRFATRFLLILGAVGGLPPCLGQVLDEAPPARTEYKGRWIARTMHYGGAPWLVRESREREEDCTRLLQALGVEKGDVVCDLGCGNGFYTLKLAALVGERGRVLAVDIQPQMLRMLEARAREEGLGERLEPILGELHDPRLPVGELDLVLLVDVYHELSHPEHVLRAIHRSLKPDGRVVLAEFRSEDPEVPIKRLHKMSKAQVLRELLPNGFRLVEEFDGLPWQHLMFFQAVPPDPLADRAREVLGESAAFLRSSQDTWITTSAKSAMGEVSLRAFRVTGDEVCFEVARQAARALARLPDADASPRALSYLIELDDLVEEAWLDEAIEAGITQLLMARYDYGPWPPWQAPRAYSWPSPSRASLQAILEARDAEGRWSREGRIYLEDYEDYLNRLVLYLEQYPL